MSVGVILFGMDKGTTEILEQHLAYCAYRADTVHNGQFLYPGKALMPQPGILFLSVVTKGPEQFIPFVEVRSSPAAISPVQLRRAYPCRRLAPHPLLHASPGLLRVARDQAHAASRNDNNCSVPMIWTIPEHVASATEPIVTMKTT